MTSIDALRFPVGKFAAVKDTDAAMRAKWIDDIAATPENIAALVGNMTPAQMKTPYREGGWTAAQVVHHMADSHVNAYIRTRFALAEDHFTVKPYDENRWAQFPDAMEADVSPSLNILEGLHARWAALLRTLTPADFSRQLHHPERGPMTIDSLVQLYAWHGKHHAGHLRIVKGTV
jgi:hypothetical protein